MKIHALYSVKKPKKSKIIENEKEREREREAIRAVLVLQKLPFISFDNTYHITHLNVYKFVMKTSFSEKYTPMEREGQ